MRPYHFICILVTALLLLEPTSIEAKRRKHKGNDHHDSHRSKTKTKWSTSSSLGGENSQVATEEHGYYVKRTYSPHTGVDGKRKSPPYLAIPIAWFGCEAGKAGCNRQTNSGVINSPALALSEGYLCDDDCEEGYEPICGQTSSEIAVFYNKCKLNVAKCRTHGLWTDLPYEQCKQTYPTETAYTEKKFKCSPYFRDDSKIVTPAAEIEHDKDSNESSEEQSSEEKHKNKKKAEKVDPIMMSLQENIKENLMPVPVPVAVEPVALPPMPIKRAESQVQIPAQPAKAAASPKPVEVVIAPSTDQLNAGRSGAAANMEQQKPNADKDKLKYDVSSTKTST